MRKINKSTNKPKNIIDTKLKNLKITSIIFIILCTLCFALGIIFSNINLTIWSNVCLGFSSVFLIVSSILNIIENNRRAKITNKSVEYYKNFKPLPTVISLIFTIFLISGYIYYYYFNEQNNATVLTTINLALFPLVFTLYSFITPTIKHNIDSIEQDLNNLSKSIKENKEVKKIDQLKEQQGDLYSIMKSLDLINLFVFISGFLLILSILCLIVSNMGNYAIFSLMSIIYNMFIIIFILYFIYKTYNYKLKMYEKDFIEQIEDLETFCKQKNEPEQDSNLENNI